MNKNKNWLLVNVYYFLHFLRILIGSGNRTAYGVQFVRNGKNLTAYCNKEVILSAGTINSPQLLMLSGIGPQQQLSELNIPVIADLPVGMNMQVIAY